MGLSGYLDTSGDDLQPVDAADEEEQQRLRLLAAGPPGNKPAWWKPPTDIPAPRPIEDAVAPESPEPPPDLPAVAAAPVRSVPPGPMPVDQNVQDALARRNAVFGNKPVPKDPKWWQRALAGAAGFGAGYYNAEGKARHIDPSAAIDAALGGPGNRKREDAWKHDVQTAELGLQGAQGEREAWFKKNKEEADQRLQEAQAEHARAQAGEVKAQGEAIAAGTKDRYMKVGDGIFDKKAGTWKEQPTSKIGTIVVDPAWAKENLPMLVPDPVDGKFRVPAAGLDKILGNVTKPDPAAKENEQMWIATLNSATSTPEQKRVAKANLDESIRQKKATQPPPPDRGQNFVDPTTGQLVRVEPGQAVPKGAQTASTFSTQNAPTMQMRNVGAQASLVHEQTPHMLSEIDRLGSKLGTVMGRWNEFYQGRVGMDDPDFAGLRADLLMYASAVALMHARGRLPENLRAEFDHAINAPKQSPANLKAVITRIDDWTSKNMNAMGVGNQQPKEEQWTRDANGALVKK